MESSKEIKDDTIKSGDGIWSAFSWDNRDTEADDLPMMNSIAWPLCECDFYSPTQINNLFQTFEIQVLHF